MLLRLFDKKYHRLLYRSFVIYRRVRTDEAILELSPLSRAYKVKMKTDKGVSKRIFEWSYWSVVRQVREREVATLFS